MGVIEFLQRAKASVDSVRADPSAMKDIAIFTFKTGIERAGSVAEQQFRVNVLETLKEKRKTA